MIRGKVEGMIKDEGDVVGWDENQRVGPRLLAAKASIIRLIPKILPEDVEPEFYQLFLQHDDFGVHNMEILVGTEDARITSLYDWETGCVVPGILIEIDFSAAGFDMGVKENGEPWVNVRTPPAEGDMYEKHAEAYLEVSLLIITKFCVPCNAVTQYMVPLTLFLIPQVSLSPSAYNACFEFNSTLPKSISAVRYNLTGILPNLKLNTEL